MIGMFCTKPAEAEVRTNKKHRRRYLYAMLFLLTVALYRVMRAIVRNKRGDVS